MRIWNASTGKERTSFRAAASRVNAIAYSPDGNGLATGSLDGPIGLWDSRNGNPAGILRGHTEPVFEVAFSNDGTKLISAGQHATIKVWDLTSDRGVRFLRAAKRGKDLETSFNGDAPAGSLAWWSRLSSGRRASLPPRERTRRWRSGICARESSSERCNHRWGAAFALAYDHTGTRLAFAGSDRSVRIHDLKSGGEPLVISDQHGRHRQRCFQSRREDDRDRRRRCRPRSSRPRSGSLPRPRATSESIRLWDVVHAASPRRTLRGHAGSIHALAFSPDDKRLISAGADGSVRVWNVETGEVDPHDEGV